MKQDFQTSVKIVQAEKNTSGPEFQIFEIESTDKAQSKLEI